MKELADSINKFLEFSDFKILEHNGTVSHQQAIEKAKKEYEEFNKTQKIKSDFDRFTKRILQKNKL